ncbi:MAG: sulfatase-like hydrolase/transferase [Elusimicrobia bacterium]|nr:sulfatase-like hydrolase/transferase [Candidatus Liberimonas magnetica]
MKKLDFELIVQAIKKLIVLNGIFLLLMSLYRLFFFVYFANFNELKGQYWYVFKAFFLGFRYDLAIIAYINALVSLSILIILFARNLRLFDIWKKVLKIYYTLAYSLLFLIIITDFGFYLYFKNHINILIFGIFEDDTKALFSTIYQSYPIIKAVVGFLVFIILVNFIIRYFVGSIKDEIEGLKPYSTGIKVIFVFCLLAGNFIAARGSFGLFPLGVMDAALSPNEFINKLSLTGVHTLQEALEFRAKEGKEYDLIKEMGYQDNVEQVVLDFLDAGYGDIGKQELQLYLVKKTRKNDAAQKIKPNVIVIMCEGFGTDLARYNSKSFNVLGQLKGHFEKDYLFTNFLSGDIGTIGSIEAVIYNVPKRPQSKAISQSKYAYKEHSSGAAVPYKKAGYDTLFLYGGNANWRNMQSIVPNIGFDAIEGEGAMDPSYPKNQWGVYDEFLFDHIYKKLQQNSARPKFIFAMTTSNHPPYSLPPGYKLLPLDIPGALQKRITGNKNLAMQRFQTYQYTNQKLGEFISRVKNSELGKNTIIAVTGDHNFWDVVDYSTEDSLNHFGVPFYLYIPDSLKPNSVDLNTVGSHVDIMPTLYNLSLSDAQYLSIGNDMLDARVKHIGFNVANLVIAKEAALIYTPANDTASYYSWKSDDKRTLKESKKFYIHETILKHYKAALALSDYLIKHPFKF